MNYDERVSIERIGFVALVVFLFSPIFGQGIWLPLVNFFGSNANAFMITCITLCISGIILITWGIGNRWSVWLPFIMGGLTVIFLTIALSLGTADFLTLFVSNIATAFLVWWLVPRIPDSLDGLASRNKFLTSLYLLMALFSILSVSRLSIFIGDPTRVDMQALPGDAFVETHSCLSAYARASDLVHANAENIYDDHWWYGSNGLPPLPAGATNHYNPFSLDSYLYPPPFLLLMELLAGFKENFFAQRALWFGINGLLVAFGLWSVAKWIDGTNVHRVLLLSPLLLGSIPFLVVLQIGNFHLGAMILSILAMIAFNSNRIAIGGGLLAFSVLSKLSPGILGLVLLLQRRYKTVAITAGLGFILIILSVLWFGFNPLWSFVNYALPRFNSGTAFPFMTTESGILTNRSLFGFPFKFQYLGFDIGDPWILARWISKVYSIGLILLAVVVACKSGNRLENAIRWMSLLVVAGIQSPFSPAYAVIGLLWATILLSVEVESPLGAIGLIALWPALLITPPNLSAIAVILGMAQTILTLIVSVWLILRTTHESVYINLEIKSKEAI